MPSQVRQQRHRGRWSWLLRPKHVKEKWDLTRYMDHCLLPLGFRWLTHRQMWLFPKNKSPSYLGYINNIVYRSFLERNVQKLSGSIRLLLLVAHTSGLSPLVMYVRWRKDGGYNGMHKTKNKAGKNAKNLSWIISYVSSFCSEYFVIAIVDLTSASICVMRRIVPSINGSEGVYVAFIDWWVRILCSGSIKFGDWVG